MLVLLPSYKVKQPKIPVTLVLLPPYRVKQLKNLAMPVLLPLYKIRQLRDPAMLVLLPPYKVRQLRGPAMPVLLPPYGARNERWLHIIQSCQLICTILTIHIKKGQRIRAEMLGIFHILRRIPFWLLYST